MYKRQIQTIGRAARNVSGEVHMYADTVTDSMREALSETMRRRDLQIAYNREHGIDPKPLRKRIADVTDMLAREQIDTESLLEGGYRREKTAAERTAAGPRGAAGRAQGDLASLIEELSEQMMTAAAHLQFELAARLRDEIEDLKKELRAMKRAQ